MNPIEIKELRKYYGDVKAVDGITFTVNTGEVFALLGPNGAGKTTTIEILEGLRKKDSGEVQVLGLDPWEDGPDVHLRIGVIPQEFNFFEKTSPREAIHLYARLFDVEVDADEILREVLLEERRPDGRWEGYTPEYVHTIVEADPKCSTSLRSGQMVRVCMGEPTGEGMTGLLVE